MCDYMGVESEGSARARQDKKGKDKAMITIRHTKKGVVVEQDGYSPAYGAFMQGATAWRVWVPADVWQSKVVPLFGTYMGDLVVDEAHGEALADIVSYHLGGFGALPRARVLERRKIY